MKCMVVSKRDSKTCNDKLGISKWNKCGNSVYIDSVLTNGGKCDTEVGRCIDIAKDWVRL